MPPQRCKSLLKDDPLDAQLINHEDRRAVTDEFCVGAAHRWMLVWLAWLVVVDVWVMCAGGV